MCAASIWNPFVRTHYPGRPIIYGSLKFFEGVLRRKWRFAETSEMVVRRNMRTSQRGV